MPHKPEHQYLVSLFNEFIIEVNIFLVILQQCGLTIPVDDN